MPNLLPVYLRELRSYFYTPVAWFIAVIFLMVSGVLFTMILLDYSRYSFEIIRSGYGMPLEGLTVAEGILRPTLSTTCFLLLLITPILTMRAFSEEKKSGTIEILFTWPLKDSEIVVGKFLASFSMSALLVAGVFSYSVMMAWFKPFPAGEAFAGFAGVLLLAAFFTAIGVFVSSLTENQILAAAWSFGMNMLFWLVGWLAGDADTAANAALRHLSAFEHMQDFSAGVFDSANAVYFLSGVFLFIFLTLRALESKRWRS